MYIVDRYVFSAMFIAILKTPTTCSFNLYKIIDNFYHRKSMQVIDEKLTIKWGLMWTGTQGLLLLKTSNTAWYQVDVKTLSWSIAIWSHIQPFYSSFPHKKKPRPMIECNSKESVYLNTRRGIITTALPCDQHFVGGVTQSMEHWCKIPSTMSTSKFSKFIMS